MSYLKIDSVIIRRNVFVLGADFDKDAYDTKQTGRKCDSGQGHIANLILNM